MNRRCWITLATLLPAAVGLAIDALIAFGAMGRLSPTIAVCGFLSGAALGLLTVYALWLNSTLEA